MKKNDADPNKWYPNPSAGLNVWGPLVPANDCKPCMIAMTGFQFLTGAAFCFFPGRNPPLGRTKWRNRGIKLAGLVAGSYLIFFSLAESLRFILPYDPWVEEAKAARARTPTSGILAKWFGPPGYKAMSTREWLKRTEAYLDMAASKRNDVNHAMVLHRYNKTQQIRSHNRKVAQDILHSLNAGTFESKSDFEGVVQVIVEDGIDVDELEFDMFDHWEPIDKSPLNLAVVPQSARYVDTKTTRMETNVFYNTEPMIIKKVL